MQAPLVREMIFEAAKALKQPFSNTAIKDYILGRWPETNENTIGCMIIICTVNQSSRINYAENFWPRLAEDPRYDLLYRIDRGQRVLYDPELHGVWRIAQSTNDSLVVVCDGEVPVVKALPDATAAMPIEQVQIDAANRLHQHLSTWAATEQGFKRLRDDLPGFNLPAVLMKAAAVNDLYSTRVYAIWRMAVHIADVGPELPDDPVEAVLTIGQLPGGRGGTHRSFASKFCHFFIDPDRFPIYDSYCEQMVRRHLGKKEAVSDPAEPYRAFKPNIDRLRDLSGVEASYREIDRYLWLAGQYRDWLANGDAAQINTALRELFDDPTPDVAADLAIIRGTA